MIFVQRENLNWLTLLAYFILKFDLCEVKIMQKYRFFKYVVALLLSICLSACSVVLPSTSMSEAEREEKKVESAEIFFGEYGREILRSELPSLKEANIMRCTDIIVGKVIGNKISAHWQTEYVRGHVAVLSDIIIEQVLFGEFKEEDIVTVFTEGRYIERTNMVIPYEEDLGGGFLEMNERVLLFVRRFSDAPEDPFVQFYRQEHPYELVLDLGRFIYARTVDKNGLLGYRNHSLAGKDDFAECKTVQDVCNRIPQALNAYRDMFKKDHPLLATYRATPNAEPGVPENYVYYADLPKEAEKE